MVRQLQCRTLNNTNRVPPSRTTKLKSSVNCSSKLAKFLHELLDLLRLHASRNLQRLPEEILKKSVGNQGVLSKCLYPEFSIPSRRLDHVAGGPPSPGNIAVGGQNVRTKVQAAFQSTPTRVQRRKTARAPLELPLRPSLAPMAEEPAHQAKLRGNRSHDAVTLEIMSLPSKNAHKPVQPQSYKYMHQLYIHKE